MQYLLIRRFQRSCLLFNRTRRQRQRIHVHTLASRLARQLIILLMGCAMLVLFAASARAVNPALSGSLSVPFLFSPDDPNSTGDSSFWYWSQGISGGISLSVPSVLEITTSVLGTGLDWNSTNIWNTYPLDSGGLSIGHTGSGSFGVSVNSNSPNLNVLGATGPTEGTVQTRVDFSNIHGSGSADGFGSATILSNTVATKYNVTIPAGAQVKGYAASNVQNITVNHNGALALGSSGPSFGFVRQNFTNHGSADLNGEVQGNFINDALSANGDMANAIHLVLDGQLQNTGELRIPNYFKTVAATSNAGTMKINGGDFNAGAAFANNGTIEFSGGNVNGPGVITNNGFFQWTDDGSIGASAEIINASTAFTINTPGAIYKYLAGTVTNTGTITQSGATDLEIGGGTINNQAGALYDITDDSQISFFLSAGTINNAGTFRKSGGSARSTTGLAAFNNSGTIVVTSGTLRFHGGGSLNSGTINFSGGHTLELEHGDFPITGTNTASGSGTLEINGAHAFASDGVSSGFANFTAGANLRLTEGLVEGKMGGTLTFNLTGSSTVQLTGEPTSNGGSVGGLGTTINAGNFQWVHGNVVGNFANSSNSFTIVAGQQRINEFGHLTNTGTISQGDGSILTLAQTGSIANQAGALWVTTGTNSIFNGSQAGPINNAGIWRKSGASTTSTINSVPFNNTGTLAIDSGKLFIVGLNTLNLMPAGTLSFKLSGLTAQVDFGTLEGQISLTAAGGFALTLAPGFAPSLDNSFDLIDWCSTCTLDGTFSTFALPLLASGLKWDTSQLYTTGTVAVGVGIPGDFNQDGLVDARDYVVWRKNVGTTYTQADYNAWRTHFGQISGGGASLDAAAIPEPASATLLALALAFTAKSVRVRS